MRTRREVVEKYTLTYDGLTVRSHGAFEGQPAYAVAFCDEVDSGHSDETIGGVDGPVDIIFLNKNDHGEWPELSEAVAVGIWRDDNGFVHCEVFDTSSELDNYRTRLEQEVLDATM